MKLPVISPIMKRIRNLRYRPEIKEIPPEQRKTGCLLATIAVTFRCMCKCAHCGSASYRASAKEEMSTEEIKNLIKDLREIGVNSINFFGGEPLIRKDLPELVKYVKSFGMGAAIDTNGYLLDREMASRLAEAGMDMVHVSIDSADPAKHDGMRGVPGIFDRAVAAIKYSKEAGMTTRIGAYVDRERLNNGEFERLIELGRKLGAPLRTLTPVLTGKWQDAENERLNDEEKRKFRALLGPGVAYWEQATCNSPDAEFICACLEKDYLYITVLGDVTPCVYVPLSFGNIHREPLRNIVRRMWASNLFKLKACNQCLTNTDTFRKKYVNLKAKPGAYPTWIG